MGMYNPPHPGEVLMGLHIEPLGITITEAARRLDVTRKALSELINGHSSVSVAMALRLSKSLNTTPELWLGMQQAYDLWHATHDKCTIDLSRVMPLNENIQGAGHH